MVCCFNRVSFLIRTLLALEVSVMLISHGATLGECIGFFEIKRFTLGAGAILLPCLVGLIDCADGFPLFTVPPFAMVKNVSASFFNATKASFLSWSTGCGGAFSSSAGVNLMAASSTSSVGVFCSIGSLWGKIALILQFFLLWF